MDVTCRCNFRVFWSSYFSEVVTKRKMCITHYSVLIEQYSYGSSTAMCSFSTLIPKWHAEVPKKYFCMLKV